MMTGRARVAAAAGALLALATSSPGFAATAEVAGAAVSTSSASFTPWLLGSTPAQSVQQLVQCGDTMYAVGHLSAIGQGTSTYSRGNAFSFSASTGAVTAWDPAANGTVHSIALSPDCSTAYLGGTFTSAGGASVSNIVAVDTRTGASKTSFASSANNAVETLQYTHGIILAGGKFTSVNGTGRTRLASLDPISGAVTTYANLDVSGRYPNFLSPSMIYNSELSHSGAKMLVEGVFTSIGGQARQQIAILDLGASSVTVDSWYSTEFDRQCVANEAFYVKGANWSVDDNTVYVATTGYKPASGIGSVTSDPRDGLCDAAAAFPATSALVVHTWINYTGCDSLYDVVADATTVYIGGHERWANNGGGCDRAGLGAVDMPGIGSLDPGAGQATAWNPTRSRGHGVNDLVLTAAGLWIASDNGGGGGSQMCARATSKGGICFLPY